MKKHVSCDRKNVTTRLNKISDQLRQIRESGVSSGSAIYERDGYRISVFIPNAKKPQSN